MIAILATLLLAGAVLGACGGNDSSGSSARGPDMMDGESMHHDMDMSASGGAPSTRPVAEGAREIAIAARSFAFEPSEVAASPGEELAIALTAEDTTHDFVIDELDVHIEAKPGSPEAGGVRADEPGTYAFYCSVPGHRAAGMKGALVVS